MAEALNEAKSLALFDRFMAQLDGRAMDAEPSKSDRPMMLIPFEDVLASFLTTVAPECSPFRDTIIAERCPPSGIINLDPNKWTSLV